MGARDNSRGRRIADQIQRLLAELIQTEVRDPRLGMVTITAVEVTHELEHAKVFFTVLGDAAQAEETGHILNHAAGFLRSALARRLKLRTTPQLHFVYDTSIEHGNRLSALIDQAVSSDQHPDDDGEGHDDPRK